MHFFKSGTQSQLIHYYSFCFSEIAYDSQDELTSLAKGSLPVLGCLLIPQLKDVFHLACNVLHLLSKCLCLIKSAGSTMSESSNAGITTADQSENINTFCAKVLKEATEKVQNRLSKSFNGNLMLSPDYYRKEELKVRGLLVRCSVFFFYCEMR